MEKTYTKQEVIDKVREYLRSNNRNFELRYEDFEMLGHIELAFKQPSTVTTALCSRVGKQYPKTVTA